VTDDVSAELLEGPPSVRVGEPEAEAPAEEPPVSEIDILDPQSRFLTLKKNDVDVEIVPLETRQLFRFMRIITHGMGPRLGNIDFAPGGSHSSSADGG
jgi:hypothetical protein